ncbi:MAG TPA: DNA (cytosine-5-)-methyltransferase [Thermoanaerobaculia bacterium]|nr:DNA (cytosine-5-)-methyltransferase [Thermoanaerobaculia bacterium]
MSGPASGALPRVLDLHCGIGGCAAALEGRATVTAAIDVNTIALGVYRHNFAHRTAARAIESLRTDDPLLRGADLWWMSPPCQPYTRRGKGRDLDDPRSRGFLHLLDLIERLRPPALALENVPEMRGSQAHARLREVLDHAGYAVAERMLCPTELGVPNRRRRFYLVASRERLRGWTAPFEDPASTSEANASVATALVASSAAATESSIAPLPPLAAYVDSHDAAELRVSAELFERYAHAVDVVDADDPGAIASTFTAAYGRSPVRAGSYLRRNGIVRRFSPREILRLLGFPATYELPTDLPLANAWRLVGNSLSVPAVREVLSALLQ